MFNKLVSLLIRSMTETLKCLIFFTLFIAAFGLDYEGKEKFRLIVLSGFILYLLVTASIAFIYKNSRIEKIKTFSCILVSFIISFLIISTLSLQYKMFCILYLFGIIAFAIIHYDEVKDFQAFVKKYMFSTLCCLIYIGYIQSLGFIEIIKIYFPMYLIMSILHIVQVNILKEYRDCSANLSNEDANIGTLDLIAISIAAISVITFTTDFFNKIYNAINYILERIIYMLGDIVVIIANWINESSLFKSNQRHFIPQSLFQKMGVLVTLLKSFLNFILVIAICIIIHRMYIILKNNKAKNNKVNTLDFEKKLFIFEINKSQKTKKKRSKENLKDLHVIRRIYIDVIKTLENKGVKYNSSYTPNEYNKAIENTEFKSKNIDQLVNIYNGLRYGNKTVSKEEILTAYEIKKSL